MESKESSGNDDGNDDGDNSDDGSNDDGGNDDGDKIRDYPSQNISKDETRKEARTMGEHLEDLEHEAVLAHQNMLQSIPRFALHILCDHSKLREASAELTKKLKKGDLDVLVCTCVMAMIGLLNIYTDQNLKYSWKRASEVVAKTQGSGMNHARCIHKWAMAFLKLRVLPLHQLNKTRGTILDDKDIAGEIKMQMMEKVKRGFLRAKDVMKIVASPKMQAIFVQKSISKASISAKTAFHWLDRLGWSYGNLRNGMYLDGHKRPDVVEYRQSFVEHWMGHERQFHQWDNNGIELPCPNGFLVLGTIGQFHLILITHDESTFFQNDERKTGWSHTTTKSKLKAKGNGQTLMVSDFLTPDLGQLHDGDE